MKFSKAIFLATLIVSAVPVFAQHRAFDLSANAVWVDPNSAGTFNSNTPNQPLNVNFDGDLGYGVAANIFWGDHVSTEFAISRVQPEPNFRSRSVGLSNDGVEMIPITGVLQWHFAPNAFIDPYIGAGAAYVLFSDVDNFGDVNNAGINRIDFKDNAGLAVNAGLGFRFSPRFGINVDAKYVPVSSNATATYITGPNTETKIDINPVIVSAGLQLRF